MGQGGKHEQHVKNGQQSSSNLHLSEKAQKKAGKHSDEVSEQFSVNSDSTVK